MTTYRYDQAGGVAAFDESGAQVGSLPLGHPDLEAWLAEGNTIAPYVKSLDELLAQVDEIRDRQIAAGITFNAHAYQSDERSRANLAGVVAAVAAGIALPPGFAWRDAANVDVPMAQSDVVAFGAAMVQRVNACYAKSWALKAELVAAADPSTVDLQSGWPPS